jgi:two-component system, OmpR family, phosphate regulon sensor histidine kinase PhoR
VDKLTGISPKRLRTGLVLFLIALAVPSGILIQQAYSQLKWQSFHQHRIIAEDLASRIDSNLRRVIAQEESRSFSDYQFLVVGGKTDLNYLQRSPLSNFPPAPSVPGTIGYFQVDSQGALSTPLLPQPPESASALGIVGDDYTERLTLENRIRGILSRNRLVGSVKGELRSADARGFRDSAPEKAIKSEAGKAKASPEVAAEGMPFAGEPAPLVGQAAFDQLKAPSRQNETREREALGRKQGKIADFNLDYSYQANLSNKPAEPRLKKQSAPGPKRAARKERTTVAAPAPLSERSDVQPSTQESDELRIHTFESEIDPFEFSQLDSGHFVLFRKVWRDRERIIQGLLIDREPFLDGIASTAFEESTLSAMSDLIVAYQGTVYSAFKSGAALDIASEIGEFSGSVLYQTRLSPPLNDFELVFSVTRLPLGPGASLITWVAVVLGGVLLAGFLLMYRAGLAQIRIARQQRNFVSAISHELKTPLTSIRMYSEMLREGWTPEEKKITYYQYILGESERLTRLINNVLQLAKLGRGEVKMEIRPVAVEALLEGVREKVLTQTESAGFTCNLSIAPELRGVEVETDPDAFTQIIINLVDNAIKFSRKAEKKIIELGARPHSDGAVRFSVRDYGPGIAPNQMKKIFKLFYRAENELTRETVGTGIGLALVQQLASRMHGQVDVVNQSPGAEFRITITAPPLIKF